MLVYIYFLLIARSFVYCVDNNNLQHDTLPAMTSSTNEQQATSPLPNRKLFESDTFGQIQQKSLIGYKPQTENVLDILYEKQKECYETEVLMNIIAMILRLIKQDPNTNGKLAIIFTEIREQLRSTQQFGTESTVYDQLLKLEDKLDDNQPLRFANDKESLHKTTNQPINIDERTNTKIVFKSEIPRMNQPTCKQAFMNLLQKAYENYIHLLEYGTCEESIDSHNEKINILPIPLKYTEVDNNAYKPVDADGYNNQIPNSLLNIYLPNDKKIQQLLYKPPLNTYISQSGDGYINNLHPEDSKTVYVIPNTKKLKKENVLDSLLHLLNISPRPGNQKPNEWTIPQKIHNIYSLLLNHNIADTHPLNSIKKLLLKYPQQKEYILNNYHLSNANVPNSLNTDDYYRKLDEILSLVTHIKQFNTSIVKPGDVELTYVVKHPEPVIYQPYHYVKYRLPYKDFMVSVNNILLIKPQLKEHPVKLYNEIVTVSNLSEMSPGLKGLPRDKIVQLTHSSGRLVNTQVLPYTLPFNINERLRPSHDFNSGMNIGNFLNLNKGFTYGNHWNDFKTLYDKVNNAVPDPLELKKRYKIVNNIPSSDYNTYHLDDSALRTHYLNETSYNKFKDPKNTYPFIYGR